jgi:BatD DUF11 like domain
VSLRRAIVILAFLLAPATALAAPPVEFTLQVTPSTGTVDDEFIATVQIAIKGVNGAERFWEPDWGDFMVTDKREQQSTQWSYDPQAGQEIRSVEVRRFLLKARRAGKLRIGEAKLKVDGVEYKTKPLVVQVNPGGGGTSAAAPDPNNPNAAPSPSSGNYPPPDSSIVAPTFIHVVADRTKVRVGEQITVTWLLYTRSEVLKYEPKPPRFDDLWVETLYEPQNYLNYSEEVVGQRTYAVAVLAKRAIFPTKAGKLAIPAFRADVATMATPFGSPLRLSSKEVPIEVEALPPGAPAGFDPGLVGQFQIEAGIDRDNVPAGESVELSLTLRGEGAIRRTKIPSISVDGFDVYPPRDFQEHVDTSGDKVRGERRFSYVLTPNKGGTLPLGPIQIPYFNTATGRYDVARSDLMKVKVVGDPAQLAGAGSSRENVISRDIRPPHELGAASSRFWSDLHRSRLFWVGLATPGFAFLGVILVDFLRQRMRRETPRARLRRARGRARKRQKLAEVHIRGNRPAKFFGEIAHMLNEHVEERVGEPIAALTRDQLRQLLSERGFPAEVINQLVTELEACDMARFAPTAAGPGEMRAALRRAQDLLRAIEKVRPLQEDEEEEDAA